MPDFSAITNDPIIRAVVQSNTLERAFHDALFPRLLFRGEAAPILFPGNLGDQMLFSRAGLIPPSTTPLPPGQDPSPQSYAVEQWAATMQQYGGTIDSNMLNSAQAIANLFLRNAQQLGLAAGRSLNTVTRDRIYQAGLCGNTYATADNGGPATTVHVASINGFTTARNTVALNGSKVRFDPVSSSNPLPIHFGAAPGTAVNVIGAVPDTAGDAFGPGTLTLDVAQTIVKGDAILADDRAVIVRVGGGQTSNGIANTNLFDLQSMRDAVARMRTMNVPEMADGWFHCHVDPQSESQVYASTEFQRLNTALPDYYHYARFAIGTMLGAMFIRNSENPLKNTVFPFDGTYSVNDPFPGDLSVPAGFGPNAGTVIHRPVFIGAGAIYEYYLELSALITDAGVTGRVGEPVITNNGIEVFTDRIRLLIRSPLDRLQQIVSTTWQFVGDWPVATDATSGDAARYKRILVVEHGGSV